MKRVDQDEAAIVQRPTARAAWEQAGGQIWRHVAFGLPAERIVDLIA